MATAALCTILDILLSDVQTDIKMYIHYLYFNVHQKYTHFIPARLEPTPQKYTHFIPARLEPTIFQSREGSSDHDTPQRRVKTFEMIYLPPPCSMHRTPCTVYALLFFKAGLPDFS
jgi:hypothetical protein